MIDGLALPFSLFIPVPIALYLTASFFSDNVEYLILHYDPGHKKTLKDLIKSGWAKVAGLFAPRPSPVPQPTI